MSSDAATAPVIWHDDARLLGVRVSAFFFDAAEINAKVSFVERCLPMFKQALPRKLGQDDQRESYRSGDLWAQPDAVLEHGNGLLCLTHRHTERQWLDQTHWPGQVRIDGMLHTVAAAMAVAGARQQPVVALLRLGNAVLQFAPSPPVLECLATSISDARRYWNAPQFVTAAQLGTFCESRLRALPGMAASAPPMSLRGAMSA